MKTELKIKALAQLARTPGEAARSTLESQFSEVEKNLLGQTEYSVLDEQLNVLNSFAFRLPEEASSLLLPFIEQLYELKLTYAESASSTTFPVEQYQNAETLALKAIEVLGSLRYLQPDDVFHTLLRLASDEREPVRKKAAEVLSDQVGYNLTVFNGTIEQPGIGPAPQEHAIDTIEKFDDDVLRNHFGTLVEISNQLLSPTMGTTSWGSQTVTWTTAAIPASPEVRSIRHRTISLLEKLYGMADSAHERRHVISALRVATRPPPQGDYDDKVRAMVAEDTVYVLSFFKSLVTSAELPMIQRIEHDSYWIFYHAGNDAVRNAALTVEDSIQKHSEYQIYRDLIGYEGIFGDWASLAEKEPAVEKDDYREKRATEYAHSITEETYEDWKSRILVFSDTESNAIAGLPIFYRFLNEFAEEQPLLALRLISGNSEQLERFLVPLLRGLWASNQKQKVRELISEWITEERHLSACVNLFLQNDDLDIEILTALRDKTSDLGDPDLISSMISFATSNYEKEKLFLSTEFFLPAVAELTKRCDSRWIVDFWYRNERKELINDLDTEGVDLVLKNLVYLEEVDYQAEEILFLIVQTEPEKVVRFFGDRLALRAERRHRVGRYEAIPFEFHKLQEPLAKIPQKIVHIVRDWYTGDYSEFTFGGGLLVKNIFPEFSPDFEKALLELVHKKNEADLEFVLGILRNYEGETFILELCRQIITVLPDNSPLASEVAATLMSTGVVTGEYGMAQAYEHKMGEIEEWLKDSDKRVVSFAQNYTESLKLRSQHERQRAEEELALRKHQYGED